MASTRPKPEKVLTRSMALHNVEVISPPQTVPPASRMLPWYKAAQTVEMLHFGLRGVSYDTQTRAFSVNGINQEWQTAVLDVGQNGKRYDMAQCTRDLSQSDCGMCLEFQLATYKNSVGNKRSWDIYGFSCSLWHRDYQFYNISTQQREAPQDPYHIKLQLAWPFRR
ncbi:hypothetical protein NC653_010421 [Populus alba x Populus x berolinensis]|uniref:Gnk2-homologous domain-containing protein n=2 Tax=Populus TaxID=3689 RepID=A0A4U5MXQ1_POPAL|nr:hypothetical protein NC653_010421 [Populus alba x Populus x berolinensis]TKR74761.1 hypothetical protein D5086_0000292280 [Populus alba]